jgi:hypothetical protein
MGASREQIQAYLSEKAEGVLIQEGQDIARRVKAGKGRWMDEELLELYREEWLRRHPRGAPPPLPGT